MEKISDDTADQNRARSPHRVRRALFRLLYLGVAHFEDTRQAVFPKPRNQAQASHLAGMAPLSSAGTAAFRRRKADRVGGNRRGSIFRPAGLSFRRKPFLFLFGLDRLCRGRRFNRHFHTLRHVEAQARTRKKRTRRRMIFAGIYTATNARCDICG